MNRQVFSFLEKYDKQMNSKTQRFISKINIRICIRHDVMPSDANHTVRCEAMYLSSFEYDNVSMLGPVLEDTSILN